MRAVIFIVYWLAVSFAGVLAMAACQAAVPPPAGEYLRLTVGALIAALSVKAYRNEFGRERREGKTID